MITAKTYKRSKTYAPEIRLAPGPRVMGDTGDNSYQVLYGYAWAAVLDRAQQRFRLLQAQVPGEGPWPLDDPRGPEAAVWVEVDVPPLPHSVKDVQHISLTFDQAARHVVAYQVGTEIWVRQWDPVTQQYIMRGPFPGVDPVVICDASVMYKVPDSDVLLFYLSPDRLNLMMRVQRENFATAYTMQTFSSPVLLDQVVQYPYRLGLVGSEASQPLSTGFWITSPLYPVNLYDRGVVATATPQDGQYVIAVLRQERAEGVQATAIPQDVAYYPAVIFHNTTPDGVQASASPQDGLYALSVIRVTPNPEGVQTSAMPQDGLYAFGAIRYAVTPEGVQVGATPQDIVYSL